LAQHLRFSKEFRDSAYNRDGLLPTHERVQANAEMRISGKPSRHAQRKSDFLPVQAIPRDCGKPDVIDFRISAPRAAAGDGDLELARQVVKLGIAAQMSVQFRSQG
jgi:hypothetical protein